MEQQPWWVAAFATPILVGIGWMAKYVLNSITTTQQSFINYLKQQTDNDREERKDWRKTLADHTEVSKQMYSSLKEMSDYLKKRNGNP